MFRITASLGCFLVVGSMIPTYAADQFATDMPGVPVGRSSTATPQPNQSTSARFSYGPSSCAPSASPCTPCPTSCAPAGCATSSTACGPCSTCTTGACAKGCNVLRDRHAGDVLERLSNWFFWRPPVLPCHCYTPSKYYRPLYYWTPCSGPQLAPPALPCGTGSCGKGAACGQTGCAPASTACQGTTLAPSPLPPAPPVPTNNIPPTSISQKPAEVQFMAQTAARPPARPRYTDTKPDSGGLPAPTMPVLPAAKPGGTVPEYPSISAYDAYAATIEKLKQGGE